MEVIVITYVYRTSTDSNDDTDNGKYNWNMSQQLPILQPMNTKTVFIMFT